MAIFGRRGRREREDPAEVTGPIEPIEPIEPVEPIEAAPPEDDVDEQRSRYGPFDVTEAPEDGRPRIDLGSVRVPVPDGARVMSDQDSNGKVRSVYVVTTHGRVEVNAYAAPRTGGLWRKVSTELAEQLRSDGAKVTSGLGEWGIELSAILNELALRFVGVDGPRWMLRGVIVGPQSQASQAPMVLRDIVRGTVVVRGDAPMPVSTPLPIRVG